MRKALSNLVDTSYRLMAFAAVTAMSFTGEAQASDDVTGLGAQSDGNSGVGQVADTLDSNFSSLGKALVGGAFLGGFGLAGAGLLKLKQAADSGGQQVKYSEGLWRIAVGAGLASLPVVTGVASGTFFSNSSGNTVTEGTIAIN